MGMTDNTHINAWNGEKRAGQGAFSTSRFGYGFAIAGDADSRPRLLVRPMGDLTVVDFLNAPGVLQGEAVRDLAGRLQGLVNMGHERLLLNLSGVVLSSSSVLGSLSLLQRRVGEAGGLLKLCGLDPVLRESLRICRLDREFVIYECEDDAFAAETPTVREDVNG
jgi:anti-sigma B factor antagonist